MVVSGKANDWKDWGRNVLNLLSNFKWVRSAALLDWGGVLEQRVPSGPFLVSRTGAVG